MSVYKTSQCNKCCHYFEFNNIETTDRVSAYGILGPPIVKCPKCDSLLKTQCSLWCQMSDNQKWEYKSSLRLKDVGFALFISMGICFLTILVINKILGFNIEFSSNISWGLILIYWTIISYYRIKKSNHWLEKVIKEIQDDYDSKNYTYR